jgi:hypothetical protein
MRAPALERPTSRDQREGLDLGSVGSVSVDREV